jgi:Cu/Ag efflux protein CusF
MKTLVLTLVLSLIWSCGGPTPNINTTASDPTPVPTASIPKDGDYTGHGIVTQVNLETGVVEIDHEAIPEVMPQKMKMMFNTKDKSVLKGVKAGDKVEFVLEYKHPVDTIKSIRKVP